MLVCITEVCLVDVADAFVHCVFGAQGWLSDGARLLQFSVYMPPPLRSPLARLQKTLIWFQVVYAPFAKTFL